MRPPVPYPFAGPGASLFGGAPAVLVGGTSAPAPVPQPRRGADVERVDADPLGDLCFDPEEAGE